MDIALMVPTTSSFGLLTRLCSNHFGMEDQGPRFVIWFHYVSPLSSSVHRSGPTEGEVKYWPTWMPFSFYQKHAAYTRTLVEKLFSSPLEWAETQMV